jgi:hypothetical protein
MCHPNKKRARR